MIYKLLTILSLMNSFLFFNSFHPLTLGLILFIQTLLISLMTGLMSQSFWFSYILFLVFIGGLMIIFMYIISLTFNNKFNLMKLNWLKLITLMIMSILLIMILMNFKNYWMINNNEMMEINFIKSMNLETSINLNKLFNYPNFMITLLLINYLFLMLTITMKISNFNMGPLRSK